MTTKIIAHRGASKLAPENTMAAFELAYQLGAEGIETDVQLTKDNVPVLMHDERLKRTTNGTGYIKDYTFNQLKQLDTGSWFSGKFTGERIVSLKSFLKWAQPKPLYLNIELKNNKIDYKHLEKIVYDILKSYRLLNRTTLSTFNSNSIKRMKSLHSDMEVAFLTSKRKKNLVQYAKELGADALHIKYRLLKLELVKQCHQEKMAIRVYTVNKATRMKKCFTHGCDGIITDFPDKGMKLRNFFMKQK